MSPELEQVVGKAVLDKNFRDKLMDDPEAALAEVGIKLSADELEKVKKTALDHKQNPIQIDQTFDAAKGSIWG